ncbi:MAG TPA: hypothetical protein VIC85_00955 [Ktedonobacterales bacterium]|jgi:hypothetical protein
MARTVVVHILNEDPILADMEELPTTTATCVYFTNPRKRDGKPVQWASPGSISFVYPMARITFIEVVTSEEERRKVVEFFRDQ